MRFATSKSWRSTVMRPTPWFRLSSRRSERVELRFRFSRGRIHPRWRPEVWSEADLDARELTLTVDEAIRRGRLNDPGTRDPLELLRGFGLVKDGVLLRAAVALFCQQQRVEAEYVQCLLRVAKFKGADKTEFVDNRQFHGNTFRLLLLAEQFLRENLPIAGRVVPGLFERIDEPLYPPVALREALANAFCHRDYAIGGGSVGVAISQDRLAITSSGSLHFGLTAEKLFDTSVINEVYEENPALKTSPVNPTTPS